MPGTTQFPAALDAFPEIGPNTPEDAPGTAHDEVHANEMAALAALQAKVGVDGSEDPASLDWRVAQLEQGGGAGWIGVTFDGGGAPIEVGAQCDVYVPYACTLAAATLMADTAGAVVIGVWADSFGNYPPTSADSITGSAPPTLASAAKARDTTLTGWSKAIAAGTTLRFNVDSCVGITRATLLLEAIKA